MSKSPIRAPPVSREIANLEPRKKSFVTHAICAAVMINSYLGLKNLSFGEYVSPQVCCAFLHLRRVLTAVRRFRPVSDYRRVRLGRLKWPVRARGRAYDRLFISIGVMIIGAASDLLPGLPSGYRGVEKASKAHFSYPFLQARAASHRYAGRAGHFGDLRESRSCRRRNGNTTNTSHPSGRSSSSCRN